MARYWRAPDGLRLDTAPFVMTLSHATGAEPLVLGKPSCDFFLAALEMLEVGAEEAVMIGDDIVGDVDGAQKAGLQGILVRTGKFQPNDLNGEIEPDAVLESAADLPDWFSCSESR
ncbi:HAD-IA family hydrolase [Solemya velesiana gill symbiont]|uniref:HAD-IA family hydrolase n=1 Tax=Solemya velesiana gill symbiont TaxID=1918948 RepID=UPI001FE8300C|nr:HAD-IA family hydrolase [Solemya velesiana gill symbiont]